MKFPESWLREHVTVAASRDEFVEVEEEGGEK